LISSVQAKAEYIAQYLGQHPKVRAIRYAGLLMALQLDSFEQVWTVIQKGLDLGIVVDWFLFNNTAVRLAPPLVISQTELEQACALLWQALDSLN
jgi:acetylornithine/succinyldiaminopimelate/putrescine aminotransferase